MTIFRSVNDLSVAEKTSCGDCRHACITTDYRERCTLLYCALSLETVILPIGGGIGDKVVLPNCPLATKGK